MPNAFAYLVFYGWPILVFALFRKLPLVLALIWSTVVGYVVVPWQVEIDFPVLPTIGKYEIVTISVAIMCYFKVREDRQLARFKSIPTITSHIQPIHKSRARKLTLWLIVLLIIAPIFTILQNGDPIIAGPRFIPGLRLYDAFASIAQIIFTLMPFILAYKFLATEESHIIFMRIICIVMVVYSLLALYEVRMSPQLNLTIYGFVPSSFLQHMRAGGFRPLVFFDHGLSLGIFLSIAILSAATLWRSTREIAEKKLIWLAAIFWLFVTLFFAKTVGAFMITALLLPIALFMRTRGQLFVAMIFAFVVLLYPMLRGAGWVPTDELHEIALSYSEERAESFKFRLDNEDALLAKANERPWFGWGTWGRNQIYHPIWGSMISVTDGVWVIVIGVLGWVGYIAQFGLLTLPVILLALNRKRLNISIETSGLAIVMSANLIDLLPNAALTPITWMFAGGLMARYVAASEALKNLQPVVVEADVEIVEKPPKERKSRGGKPSYSRRNNVGPAAPHVNAHTRQSRRPKTT